ncbi:MAG TPA: DUF4168 domain-containing protein [Pusillimonas sp.]
MHKRIAEILSTSAIAFGLATAPVLAQQAPAAKPQAPVTAPSQNYSDAQLQKFVGASQKVAVISEQYRPQLQAAKDDTARGEIYQEADDKMVAAVKDEGLSVDEFNGINRALQQDPKLKQRITKMLK